MRESTVERRIVEAAEDMGFITLKLNGSGDRGKPDRWFGYNGRTLLIEIKRPGEEPSALQRWWRNRLQIHGFQSEWCDNVDDGVRILEEFKSKAP